MPDHHDLVVTLPLVVAARVGENPVADNDPGDVLQLLADRALLVEGDLD